MQLSKIFIFLKEMLVIINKIISQTMRKIIIFIVILFIGSYICKAQESIFFLKFNSVKRGSLTFPVIEYEEDTLFDLYKDISHCISYSRRSNNWGKIIDSIYINKDTLYINLKWTITFYIDTTNDRLCAYSTAAIRPSQNYFTFRLHLLYPFSSFDGDCIVINCFNYTYYFDRVRIKKYKYCKREEFYYSFFKDIKYYKWKKIFYDTCTIRY